MSEIVFSQNIVINEILTSNTSINKDEDGSYQDWIELRNNDAININLAGFGLSDDHHYLTNGFFQIYLLVLDSIYWFGALTKTELIQQNHYIPILKLVHLVKLLLLVML